MPQCDQVKAYLDAVCAEVRWKQAHEAICRELNGHIEDQAEAYARAGLPPEQAAERAVAEMGDSSEVGQRLDASYRPRPTKSLLVPLGALLLTGVLCRMFLYDMESGQWLRFIGALAIGGGLFALLYNANLYRLAKWSPYACLAMLAAMVLLRVMANFGSYPYRNNGIAALSYAVCIFPVLLACLAYSIRGRGIGGLLLCGASVAVAAWMLFSIPAAANTLELVCACLFVLSVASLFGMFGKRRVLPIALSFGAAAGAGALMVLTNAYILMRLKTLFVPDDASGWLAAQVREVVSGARLLGPGAVPLGFAAGGDASFFMMNDFLLTSLLYRHGWIPAALVVLLLCLFIGLCFHKAFGLKSLFGRLAASAVAASFAVQTLGYVAGNLGVLIGGPLPLPFISYGNTSLAVNLALAGLYLSLLRTDGLYCDPVPAHRARLRIRLEWER